MPLRAIAAALPVLLLTLLSVPVVQADTISLLLKGESKAKANVSIDWEGEHPAFPGGLTLVTEKGETAKQFTERSAEMLNQSSLKEGYTFETKHSSLGDELRIIPKGGIPNFTKVKDGRTDGETDHGFLFSPILERKKASRSTFELQDLATALTGNVRWDAYVLRQDLLVATSTHIVSNLIEASELLTLFATDFEAQGVHVELASRMLTLNSKQAMHFFVERSDSTNLYPALAMEAVAPEPAAMTLLALGVLALTARQTGIGRRRS